jgi:hypothetical protein
MKPIAKFSIAKNRFLVLLSIGFGLLAPSTLRAHQVSTQDAAHKRNYNNCLPDMVVSQAALVDFRG